METATSLWSAGLPIGCAIEGTITTALTIVRLFVASVLAATRRPCGLANLVLAGCNDDSSSAGGPSEITLSASAGETLFIQAGGYGQVGGYHGNRGSLVVNLSLVGLPACVGDCDAHGEVTVDEIITMVNIALGNTPMSDCDTGDANGDDLITVDEILMGVNSALNGCG